MMPPAVNTTSPVPAVPRPPKDLEMRPTARFVWSRCCINSPRTSSPLRARSRRSRMIFAFSSRNSDLSRRAALASRFSNACPWNTSSGCGVSSIFRCSLSILAWFRLRAAALFLLVPLIAAPSARSSLIFFCNFSMPSRVLRLPAISSTSRITPLIMSSACSATSTDVRCIAPEATSSLIAVAWALYLSPMFSLLWSASDNSARSLRFADIP